MNELLNNSTIQGAIAALIVVALKALTDWLKSKTKGSIVDDLWCYVQPIEEMVLAAVKDLPAGSPYTQILSKALGDFASSYTTCEFKEPSTAILAAVEAELKTAVQKNIGG